MNLQKRCCFILIKLVKNYKIDYVHVHDLPLVKTGYIAAKKFKIPIIADLHENYPAAVKVYQYNKKGINEIINRSILSYKRYRKYELSILKKVNRVILVVPEAYIRFKGLIPKDKFEIVSNTVAVENFKNKKIDLNIIKQYEGEFIVTYIGTFGIHRGIDTSIRAMQYVKNKKIKLLLVGGKGDFANEMKGLAEKLNVKDKVEFVDQVPFDLVQSYIEISNVCLVPHNNFEHTQTTVPHKLFQYMYLKKPVLVSHCAPLKRIIKETKSGMVFKANDFKDMAKKIEILYDSENLKTYGVNGYNAVIEKYNWEVDARILKKIYDQKII